MLVDSDHVPLPPPASASAHHPAKATGDARTTKHPPLLLQMSQAPFVTALRKFAHLTLYANISGDIQVHHCTASIRLKNPYSRIKLASLPRAGDCELVVDAEAWALQCKGQCPCSPAASSSPQQGILSRIMSWTTKTPAESETAPASSEQQAATPLVSSDTVGAADDSEVGSRCLCDCHRDRSQHPSPLASPEENKAETVSADTPLPSSDDDWPKAFRADPRLQAMFLALDALPWERVDVVARPAQAHADIVAKVYDGRSAHGIPIVKYAVRNVEY